MRQNNIKDKKSVKGKEKLRKKEGEKRNVKIKMEKRDRNR
jgi:hypothetical protein